MFLRKKIVRLNRIPDRQDTVGRIFLLLYHFSVDRGPAVVYIIFENNIICRIIYKII